MLVLGNQCTDRLRSEFHPHQRSLFSLRLFCCIGNRKRVDCTHILQRYNQSLKILFNYFIGISKTYCGRVFQLCTPAVNITAYTFRNSSQPYFRYLCLNI